MGEFSQYVTRESPSLEVFLVIRLLTIDEPLLQNLKVLHLWEIQRSFIPFIPFFLSPRIASISLTFESGPLSMMITSTLTALQTLCPDLQAIGLYSLPRDPMTIAAVSGMLLVTSQNILQELYIDSPLTEAASEVLYKLPNLCVLSVVIERETSLPSASLRI